MEEFIPKFEEEGVCTKDMIEMTEQDLKEAMQDFGIRRLGDRFRLLNKLRTLRKMKSRKEKEKESEEEAVDAEENDEETHFKETIVEEWVFERTHVEETNVEETHVEETNVEETHVEETHVEETHVEETHVEETQVEETQVEETHVEETLDNLLLEDWSENTKETQSNKPSLQVCMDLKKSNNAMHKCKYCLIAVSQICPCNAQSAQVERPLWTIKRENLP